MTAGGVSKVAVAVLSWNGRHHLEGCLPALGTQDDPGVPWEVLVLDNGSTDGTADWVRANHPRVRLVESAVNVGFCAGNNRLVAEAGAIGADAVAFLNNDTRPEPGWLGALAGALAAAPPEVAAVSGRILDWEGRRLDFARGVMTFDGHAFQAGFRRPLDRLAAGTVPADGAELFFPCGGNMLVRRRSFLEAGGFDPDYFAYLEDVDLGWRLWAGGERVLFADEAIVHHRSMASSDLLGLYNRGFLFERNAFLTAYKNYQGGLWERVMPAILWTLTSRSQTMLVQNNPGGTTLTVDPYARAIAASGGPPPGAPGPEFIPPAAPPPERSARELIAALPAKWREVGTVELARRIARRLRRRIAPPAAPTTARLTDERTVAQFRALTYLLGHLDRHAEKRRRTQARRRVPDAEIFARFPPYLIPTYPGDERLFASPGFRAWLPPDLPLVESTLEELMEMDPDRAVPVR